MALGTNHVTTTEVTAATRTRSNSAFVPELWSDEIVAAYKLNLVMQPLVYVMNHRGRKGDTIHVPRPNRGDASQKAAETQVTLIANQETSSQYLIDQHWEYSRLIEDIVAVQAEDSLRAFYTDDAGYALAKRVDTFIHEKASRLAGADASPTAEASADYGKAVVVNTGTTPDSLAAWDPSANTNTGNAASITDEALRLMVQELDDNDVPSMGRQFVIPPVEKRKMLGIDRYVLFDNVGEAGNQNSVRNGYLGDAYGAPFFVSTNIPDVLADDSSTIVRPALYFHRDSTIFIEQMAPRTQTQYKQEWLGDLFTADILFGGGILRPEGGLVVMVPNS